MEKAWVERLEEARREEHKETAEASCQAETEASCVRITAEELDSRLSTQRQQLLLEAERGKRKAVEEARKQAQRELHEKHLDDMASQVEGAVTRAYNRWIEDLTSLPEYRAALQTEMEKWEVLQEKRTGQQVSQAEEKWNKKHKNQLEEQRLEELQEEVAVLQSQVEQGRREHAALLKAELAAARAAWSRDKQQEISVTLARSEQAYQRKLEQAVQQARGEAALHREELLLQVEAKLQQTVRAREEEWKCRHAEEEQVQRQQTRDELMTELQMALSEVQAQLLRDPRTNQQHTEDPRRSSGDTSELTVTHIIQTACRDIVNRAVSQAEKQWTKEESRERAAEMIRMEVQRERQDTARKMQRYYLICLQELLEDGGKNTGAEKKIKNAASKLAAMAKVLETPVRIKSSKNYSLQSRNAGFSKNPSTLS
ncbi:Centrosomal protein of 152 kDa [Dissostichus eleginoides]|uniref:Centrosomal protein of 152 kDa n=1 Tax=Dissostichus eleginoides TaxID=100907 RepID=A0AAD9BSF0_DISEL|nr:Centrosomal protein of 152 kDa [Dissostichus eleginoides]